MIDRPTTDVTGQTNNNTECNDNSSVTCIGRMEIQKDNRAAGGVAEFKGWIHSPFINGLVYTTSGEEYLIIITLNIQICLPATWSKTDG